MQVDMNILIKDFFASARKYADKVMSMYKDEIQKSELKKEYEGINLLEKAILDIIATPADMRESAEFKSLVSDVMFRNHKFGIKGQIFVEPNLDETKWAVAQAFSKVVYKIGEYYSSGNVFGNDPKPVLEALKGWRYRTSKNIFKDFVYPFLPLSHFAKVKNANQY